MAKAKTLRKRRFEKNAEDRTLSAWKGGQKLLQLLQRADAEIVTNSFAVNALNIR